MGGANVVGTTNHRGALVPKNRLQDLKILIYVRIVGFLDNLAVRGVQNLTRLMSWDQTKRFEALEDELHDCLGVLMTSWSFTRSPTISIGRSIGSAEATATSSQACFLWTLEGHRSARIRACIKAPWGPWDNTCIGQQPHWDLTPQVRLRHQRWGGENRQGGGGAPRYPPRF